MVDETYIDFAPLGSSCAGTVNEHPNIAVMQILNKGL
jgi:histidinol-phosphate/aromatic aminotransferase/cobyric acid decarboxylase-like protein